MIHFIGNIQSKFGRGKDKTKRKSRVNPLVGAGLGTVAGGPIGTIAGGLVARGVNKERDRFDKEGAKSHLGKVGHDALLGAKSLGIGKAAMGGLLGGAIGSSLPVRKKGFLGIGRDKKQEARDKIKNALIGAGTGILSGGTLGAINGAGTGALVGAGRGFVQENRMGKKKKGKFSSYIDTADFVFGLPKQQPTRLQTINIARKKGADITGNILGSVLGGTGAAKMLAGKGTIKGKITRAVLSGAGGAIIGKTVGGVAGGTVGTGVGVGKALLKPKQKRAIFNKNSDTIDFAFNLPGTQPKKKKQ